MTAPGPDLVRAVRAGCNAPRDAGIGCYFPECERSGCEFPSRIRAALDEPALLRAVLERLREPTEAMRLAGIAEEGRVHGLAHCASYGLIWRAMVDARLAELAREERDGPSK